MKKLFESSIAILAIGIGFLCLGSLSAYAEESAAENKTEASVTVIPYRYVVVDGDVGKFQSQHWTKAGYSSGFENLEIHQQINKTTTAEFTGRAMARDHDYGGEFEIEKEDFGYFKVGYDTFRKYYDGTGGYYYRYPQLSVTDSREQHLDIGKFEAEVGMKLPNWPELSAFFEQETKNGVKNMVTWTPVVDASTTKLIGPSSKDIYDTVDTFGFRGRKELAGVDVKGEHKWDLMRGHTIRIERNLSVNGIASASERKVRIQDIAEQADVVTTTFGGEKWFWKDKAFAALHYRHYKIDNSEVEFLREFDENLNPRSFGTSPKNKFNATGDNKYASNTVAGDFQAEALKDLNVITKFKAEVVSREGGSSTPHDTSDPPDGISNFTNWAEAENTINQVGASVGLRYSGLKHTSLYGDLELQRTRNWLQEYQDSIGVQSAGAPADAFERETITRGTKYVATLGGRTTFNKYLNFTAQYRNRKENNDYDDLRESAATSSSDKSAFTDAQGLGGQEFTGKWSSKFTKQLSGSIRYQYADNSYNMRTNNATNQRSVLVSNTFTYDLTWTPDEKFMMGAAYSRQMSKLRTPAGKGASPQIPGYDINLNSVSVYSAYIFNPKLSLTQSVNRYTQNNFNDYSLVALPYGVNNSWYDASLGLRWQASKKVSVEPKYTFYSYKSNPTDIDFGSYRAHAMIVGVNLDWF